MSRSDRTRRGLGSGLRRTLLLAALVALGQPLEHAPQELRRRAAELLGQPPYVGQEPGVVQELLRRLVAVLGELLDRLAGRAGGTPWVAWVALAVVVALLVLVVWRVTRGLAMDRGVARQVPAERGRTSADWHADADRYARAGELALAVRCRYAAVASELVEAGLLAEVPGRTVRELDAEVAVADPGHAPRVRAAGERFEEVVFGGRPATVEDLEVVAGARREKVVAGARRESVAGVGRRAGGEVDRREVDG